MSLEKNENKKNINQENFNISKEITQKVYKILLLGDSAIGTKTSLLRRLTDDSFVDIHLCTIGVNYILKSIKLKYGNMVKLQIWDTTGQDRLRNMIKHYYKKTNYIIIGYDVTSGYTYPKCKRLV